MSNWRRVVKRRTFEVIKFGRRKIVNVRFFLFCVFMLVW